MTSSIALLLILTLILALLTNKVSSAPSSPSIYKAIASSDLPTIQEIITSNPSSLNHVEEGKGGQTPIMNAVLSGKTEVFQLLLKNGADLTVAEDGGYTPIHGAGFQGRADILKLLLGVDGVDANEYHSDGSTAFHRACWGREQRHTDTVKVFIEVGGVDFRITDKKGKSCIDMTRSQETREYLEGLYDGDSDGKKKEL